MDSSTLRLTTALGTFLCLTTVAPTAGVAQEKSAAVTVHEPMRLPGGILQPGKYEFKTFAHNPYLRIYGADGFRMNVPTTPISRRNPGAAIALRSRVAGSIAELATWYPGGGTAGFEFAPQPAGANALSAANLAGLDQRLSAADDAVREAEQQLTIAESNRKVIRTERRDAR